MRRTVSTLVAATAFGLLSGAAHAASVGLNVYNTNKSGGTDLSGLNMAVDVTETASHFQFTFVNNAPLTSSITKVYFDNSLASVLSGTALINGSAGTSFIHGANTPDAPLGSAIGWTGSLAFVRSAGADAVNIANGINSGTSESLTVSFAKAGGALLTDVINLLTSTGGISLHLVHLNGQGLSVNADLSTYIAQQQQVPQDDTPIVSVPTPASAAAGIAALGLLAARRRKLA